MKHAAKVAPVCVQTGMRQRPSRLIMMAFARPKCYSFPFSVVPFTNCFSALSVIKHADSALRQLHAVAAPKKSGHYAEVAAAGGNESWEGKSAGRRVDRREAIGAYLSTSRGSMESFPAPEMQLCKKKGND